MRRMLIMANWKMHGSRASVQQLLEAVAGKVGDGTGASRPEVAVCPSFVHIPQALALCSGSELVVGAQDCSHLQSGAYTGEVSAAMLQDLGCSWVLVGHSERRQYHAESDDLLEAKLAAVVEAGLKPVLCVGETIEQRENGEAEAVVSGQLKGALTNQPRLDGLVVAYEPVWAIGTGLTATPEQAQDMHAFVRAELDGIDAVGEAGQVRVLYGGSVKPGNAAVLFAQPDIDGALVGGASLVAEDFLAIVSAAN